MLNKGTELGHSWQSMS